MNYELQYKDMKAVCTTMGAELISLTRANGREVIWQGDKTYWGGVNPNLFPIVCSLKNSKTVIDGVEYTIPKHGFARRMEFEMVDKTDNSITFLLTDNETTKACYPYSFGFYITHTLTEDGFVTTYRVENRNDRPCSLVWADILRITVLWQKEMYSPIMKSVLIKRKHILYISVCRTI